MLMIMHNYLRTVQAELPYCRGTILYVPELAEEEIDSNRHAHKEHTHTGSTVSIVQYYLPFCLL
jgi:hypothetical protein